MLHQKLIVDLPSQVPYISTIDLLLAKLVYRAIGTAP
ncbi:hypothetical protein J2774_004347 [Rhizobium pusense]|jgi:hypothetical protein|nr:hypothetical protein [Agrobacterium pusense]MDP9773333.1 hypothetical protein [Rhizobium sp. SORGH_AS_0755]